MRNVIATAISLVAIAVSLPVTLTLGCLVRLHIWAVAPLMRLYRGAK